jgi:hypothetical protein
VFDWLFRNRRTGQITIAQFPSPALWIFIVTGGLRFLVSTGATHTALGLVALVALAWWATDEVARGVNPWRRLLGAVGIMFVISSALALLYH